MSKNVYLDLGFSEDEAAERALRTELATRIAELIEDRGLTQRSAASLFEVPQPTISKIVNGKLANLSLAFLIRMLLRAGLPFRIEKGASADELSAIVGSYLGDAATSFRNVSISNVREIRDQAAQTQETDTAVSVENLFTSNFSSQIS